MRWRNTLYCFYLQFFICEKAKAEEVEVEDDMKTTNQLL